MWTTFLVALKANLRNRSALFWMTVFPIVLATMFNGLFGGLAEAYELKPVPMAVIEDTRWQQADGARGRETDRERDVTGPGHALVRQQHGRGERLRVHQDVPGLDPG